jgi:phosphoribosyl-ATP pyrophosphohydrolase/phosphoribosyl-AMP cyclohydrolase
VSMLESIRYNGKGLVPVVTQAANTGEVLMLAYANRKAVEKTVETGEAHYHSRSRGKIWRKGEMSGNTQRVVEVRLDCDGDALLYRVESAGPACHTGESSCFFTSLRSTYEEEPSLSSVLERLAGTIAQRRQEMPEDSYTAELIAQGTERVAQKVGEEAVEVIIAALEGKRLAEESADLLYHLLVLLEERSIKPEKVAKVLNERHR